MNTPSSRPEDAPTLAKALLKTYLKTLQTERNRSPYTLRNYGTDIGGYLAFLDESGADFREADRHSVRSYLASLMEREIAPASLARIVSTLRSFHRYLYLEGHIPRNPCEGMSAPKQPRRLPGFLDEEEVTSLITAPERGKPQGLRDRALLELLYAAGTRVSEVHALNVADSQLAEEGGMLRVRGKGDKERVVLIGRPATRALAEYLAEGRPRLAKGAEEAMFINRDGERLSVRAVQGIVRKYAVASGLGKRAHPHLLRHTFATHMLDGGADLRVVQELMGHASANTTQIYLHVTEARQRRVYEDAWDAIGESYQRVLQERKRLRRQRKSGAGEGEPDR